MEAYALCPAMRKKEVHSQQKMKAVMTAAI
jgi:hypothetical protein